jgi:hypothetical protein
MHLQAAHSSSLLLWCEGPERVVLPARFSAEVVVCDSFLHAFITTNPMPPTPHINGHLHGAEGNGV